MTNNPNPVPPRQPLVLPPNFREVTAEKVGTVMGIVGATAAAKTPKKRGGGESRSPRGWMVKPPKRGRDTDGDLYVRGPVHTNTVEARHEWCLTASTTICAPKSRPRASPVSASRSDGLTAKGNRWLIRRQAKHFLKWRKGR
jgi:hypothetical protein